MELNFDIVLNKKYNNENVNNIVNNLIDLSFPKYKVKRTNKYIERFEDLKMNENGIKLFAYENFIGSIVIKIDFKLNDLMIHENDLVDTLKNCINYLSELGMETSDSIIKATIIPKTLNLDLEYKSNIDRLVLSDNIKSINIHKLNKFIDYVVNL